jgi:hypothetical protein
MDYATVGQVAQDSIRLVQDLSVLVITHPGKWKEGSFHPSKFSVRKIDWFEGTGTVIGIKRNRVSILSSIHCEPNSKYSFFVKGAITNQEQVVATLSLNRFEEEDNGIDVAIFSCDASCFDAEVLSRMTQYLRWNFSAQIVRHPPLPVTNLYLVHYPTLQEEQDITRRLHEPVFSEVATGVLVSVDSECFDSTIVATAGSSGGLIVSEEGYILGSHDSQHNDTPDGSTLSTHRMCTAVREALSSVRGVSEMFATHSS